MNQHRASLTFPVFGGIPQADSYPRYTRLHPTSFEKLRWEFPREGTPMRGDQCFLALVRMEMLWEWTPRIVSVQWAGKQHSELLCPGGNMEAANGIDAEQICEIRFPGSWVKTVDRFMGRTKPRRPDVFPLPDCCFTHYEFYENCVEWNRDLLRTLKTMLEQATCVIALPKFISKQIFLEPQQCWDWWLLFRAEPVTQQELKKMGKDTTTLNPVWLEL